MQCCVSGILCLFDPRIRDPGWSKNQDPDHIPESLETVFGLKILKLFDADPESFDPVSLSRIWDGKIRIGIRDKHPGSATLIIKNQKKQKNNVTDLAPGNILITIVGNPWHFGADPDPRIRTSG
jgi:hypothetical protein